MPVKSVVESTEKPDIIKKMESLSYDVNTEDGNDVMGRRKANPVGVCEGSKSNKCWKSVFTNDFQDVMHCVEMRWNMAALQDAFHNLARLGSR